MIEEYLIAIRDELGVSVDNPSACHLFYLSDMNLVSRKSMDSMIQDIVVYLGMDPSLYSPHSLRYGGATMLASAGISIFLIEYHGGWVENSKALRGYLQIGDGASEMDISLVMSQSETSNLSSAFQYNAMYGRTVNKK